MSFGVYGTHPRLGIAAGQHPVAKTLSAFHSQTQPRTNGTGKRHGWGDKIGKNKNMECIESF